MIYDAPSKENRKHIFSNILTDLRFLLKIADVLNSAICLPQDATEAETDSALRTHLLQYRPNPDRKYEFAEKDVLNYIVSYFGLKEHNAKKVYDFSKLIVLNIEYLHKQIGYLSKIYDIDLATLPDRYEEANIALTKYWPAARYQTIRVTPFGENNEICVAFISRELQTRKSKPAKLLATIILAMEQAGAVDTLCSQTELLDYLAQYIPNLPTR